MDNTLQKEEIFNQKREELLGLLGKADGIVDRRGLSSNGARNNVKDF